MKKALTNDFSWSKSRHEKLAGGKGAYYFQYYRSGGGWESTAAPEVRELYLLKKLGNRYSWAGSIGRSRVARFRFRGLASHDNGALTSR